MLGVAWVVAAGSPARAAPPPPDRFPAAGELVATTNVRIEPRPAAPIVRTLRRFRPDQQFQIVLAVARAPRGATANGGTGSACPGHRTGRRAGSRADAVEVRPVVNRIVVRLGARRLEVRRVRDGRAAAAQRGRGRRAGRGDAARTELLRGVRLRSDGSVLRRRSPSRRAPTHASRTGRATSSESTARTGRSCSARRSRTAASASRTTSRRGFAASRRSGRRSTSCGS